GRRDDRRLVCALPDRALWHRAVPSDLRADAAAAAAPRPRRCAAVAAHLWANLGGAGRALGGGNSLILRQTKAISPSHKSASNFRQPRGGLRLLFDLQRIVELVEEAAQRDAQGQFDDLRLAEMLSQPDEQ